MARLPQNILAAMAVGKPGLQATKRELVDELTNNGYGPKKARAWVDTLIGSGAIRLVGEDPIYGRELYVCKWWGAVSMITRITPKKVRVDLTEEEAAIIESWSA